MKRKHSLFQQKPGRPDKNRLWSNIENHILTDEFYEEVNRDILQYAIQELPQQEPLKDLWKSVEADLYPKRIEKRMLLTPKRWMQLAATIVLLLSLYVVFHQRISRKATLAQPIKEEPVDVFLARICETYPGKCSEVDFIEMQDEILRLQQEKESVQHSIFGSPDDAEMTKVNEMINDQIGNLKLQITHYVRL
jgi:hypothetical protein